MADDVVSYADGGGKVNTARLPVSGREKVARHLTGGLPRFAAESTWCRPRSTAGPPGLLGFAGEQLFGVLAVDLTDGRVGALRLMANPDKLEVVQRQLASLSRSGHLPGQ